MLLDEAAEGHAHHATAQRRHQQRQRARGARSRSAARRCTLPRHAACSAGRPRQCFQRLGGSGDVELCAKRGRRLPGGGMHACVHASCGAGCMSHKETLITSFSTRTQNINEKRYPPRQARVHARGLATWASTSADHRSARRSLPTRPAEDQAGHAPAARRRQHLASSRGITRRVRRVELHCVHALNYRAGSAARVQPQLGSRGRAA